MRLEKSERKEHKEEKLATERERESKDNTAGTWELSIVIFELREINCLSFPLWSVFPLLFTYMYVVWVVWVRICDELHRDQFLRPHRNYHFTRTKQELIQQSTSTSNQSYSHSKDRIFNQKKNHHEKIFITFTPSSSSSSSLFYNEQIFIFQKKIKAIFKTKKLKNK